MRFRKSVKLFSGVKLNVSKSGLSVTGKIAPGLSVSTGTKGTYLNTGIEGTGLYNRVKISVEKMQNKKLKKAFGFNVSLLLWFVIIICLFLDLVLAANEWDSTVSLLQRIVPISAVAALCLFIWIKNIVTKKANERHLIEMNNERMALLQAMIDQKSEIIKEQDGFDGCKLFVVDHENMVAFSKSGKISFFTSKSDEVITLDVSEIQKINSEIKAGDCYAHFFTKDFDNNVIDLFLGNAHGKDATESVKSFYNEIKSMLQIAKNK